MAETTFLNLNGALAGLLDKYAVKPAGAWRIGDGRQPSGADGDALVLVPGWAVAETAPSERTVPLLPWRHERRFVELRRLVDARTVTPVLMCRFACLTDGGRMPLGAILYRELDLIEWLSGAPITGLCASMAGDRAANVIVRMAGGAIGSVEAVATLPAGAAMQDRHELIARRGVASDRVVDTQVAQSSVYAWSADGNEQYTDVDAELFGLDAEQVSLVRAAFEVLCEPARGARLRRDHGRLRSLVELALESDRRHGRLVVEGGPA